MPKIKSGKSKFISGIARYTLEELKTMNRSKLKAINNILTGYAQIKINKNKRKKVMEHNSLSYPVER